jgi:Kef-type K+ transport system membrane component KefB
MITYFEKFFTRTYLFYAKFESSSSSKSHAILLLAVLQTLNVNAMAIFITTWIRGKNYSINVLYIILSYVVLFVLNCIWFYGVRGTNKVIEKYSTKEDRKPFINPWIYIIFSVLFFSSVKVLGFWPTGNLINNPLQHH